MTFIIWEPNIKEGFSPLHSEAVGSAFGKFLSENSGDSQGWKGGEKTWRRTIPACLPHRHS